MTTWRGVALDQMQVGRLIEAPVVSVCLVGEPGVSPVALRPVPSEALLRGLVLKPPIDPGVAEIGDLGDEQKVVATKRLALVPLALLDHLAAIVDLVVILPESIDRDVVVDHLAVLGLVSPDISTDVPDSHDANGFVLTRCGCRGSAAAALLLRWHGWSKPFSRNKVTRKAPPGKAAHPGQVPIRS